MRQASQREDEQDAGSEIGERDLICRHQWPVGGWWLVAGGSGSLRLNISSMRWLTRKPPNVLMAARPTAIVPISAPAPVFPEPAARIAPTTITELIALVTLISGVCSAGVTFQTT